MLVLGGIAPVHGQTRTVTGQVSETGTGNPLDRADVIVSGTAFRTTTGADGFFSIDVPVGDVELMVRLIGYRRAFVTVPAGVSSVEVQLQRDILQLDAVIVTGTAGETEARAIGNAISAVEISEYEEMAPVADAMQLLTGRVPGVIMEIGQGNIGTGGKIRIRGITSLSLANDPLIYVDGVRINNNTEAGPNIRGGRQVSRLNDINPADIERIEVIKGPAAATLYGTEASNGVIQIITKKGEEGRPTFEATVRQGANWFQNAAGRLPTSYWRNPDTDQIEVVNLYEQEKELGQPIFTTGHTQSYNISVRGGQEGMNYYMSAQYDDEVGILDYNWRKQFGTRANIQALLSESFNVEANFGFMRTRTRLGQAASGWDIMGQIVWGSPRRLTTPTRGFLRAPPEAVGTIESYDENDRFIWGATFTHTPFDWLSQRLVVGSDVGNATASILFPRHPTGADYFFGGLSLGQKTVERVRTAYTTVDYSVTASFDLTSTLSSATSAGAQYYAKRNELVGSEGREFPAPAVDAIGGAAVTFGDEDLIENKTLGFYAQEQLSLHNRVFLTAAIRGDDNSAFGTNYDFVVYPKFSLSWVIHEEPFWSDVPLVSALKLRGAWGKAGQQPDVFAAIRLYQPTTGPSDASTLSPQTVGNPDLEPEKTQELELGFDAGLLNDRVALEFTYFRQKTKDAIVTRDVSPSIGFPGIQYVNIGEVSNWGIELGVDGRVMDTPDFSWDLGFTIATNDNEITSLGGLPTISAASGGRQLHQEGYPLAAWFLKEVVDAELDADGNIVGDVLCNGGPDNNNQPVPCSGAPGVYKGRATPTYEGSARSTFTLFDDLSLNVLVDFRGGHHLLNGDIGAAHVLLLNTLAVNERTDPILMGYTQQGLWQEAGYMDASFAKLREVAVTYHLPANLLRPFGVTRATLSVGARNLATLWRGQKEIFGTEIIDPEVRLTANELGGYFQTVLPQYTSVVSTLRFTF
jgi:TonB-linked SusC/RagA family outer membrane protein